MKNVNAEKIENNIAIWELSIQEVEGKSLEKRGREEINEMLSKGWVILSVYTLRFKDNDDTYLERPMAILGLPLHPLIQKRKKEKKKYPEAVLL
jgi:hypothetical protein